MTDLEHLFSPLAVGAMQLPNRVVMAPMTRGRAEADGAPNEPMARYYALRGDAGLLITEATAISPGGVGWLGAPGIYTEAHVAGWRRVTSAVHERGGRVYLQLWHMGRVSHPDFLGGELPVAPSAVAAAGQAHTREGKRPYVTPRELGRDEIAGIVQDYAAAASRAREAGFDGVELHAANGYLVDQFLRDRTNRRDDDYGGSPENRARFLLEVTDAIIAAWSADRMGVRLSPTGSFNDMADSDPVATFSHAASKLDERGLAYLHITEPLPGHMLHVDLPPVLPVLREAFRGPLMTNGGYDAALADAAIREGKADLVSFGLPFLANPDLVTRYRKRAPLNSPDFATLYTPGQKGYLDYPTLA